MKRFEKVRPTGLKGRDKLDRMKELMGTPVDRTVANSVVELTKLGPDGSAYAIVRENREYYIKKAHKTEGLVAEDFKYIGGLKNKKSEAYPSYAKAIKQLNLKFISINEALGVKDRVDVFSDDNLIVEHHPLKANQSFSDTNAWGDGQEYVVDQKGKKLSYSNAEDGEEDGVTGDNIVDKGKDVDDEWEKVTDADLGEMTENEVAIDNMIFEMEKGKFTEWCKSHGFNGPSDSCAKEAMKDKYDAGTHKMATFYTNTVKESTRKRKGKYSILSAINEMDEVIDCLSGTEAKISEILESLNEEERHVIYEALKKKEK